MLGYLRAPTPSWPKADGAMTWLAISATPGSADQRGYVVVYEGRLRHLSNASSACRARPRQLFPYLPASSIMGMFLGAPLLSRSTNTGTHQFAWTQSVTRSRWLAPRSSPPPPSPWSRRA